MDYERLQRVIKELSNAKGVSPTKALTDSGVGKSFFWSINKQGSAPSVEKLQALAVYFNVSVDYLIGNTDVPEVNRSEESPAMEIARMIAGLPAAEQEKLIEYAHLLANKDK